MGSTALTGDPNTFCANPELVATVEKYAWGAGIYFWMENMRTEQGSSSKLSTCHIQALSGDMGGTLWNINGNAEYMGAGAWHTKAVVMRINRYCRAASVMGVGSLLSFAGCSGMNDAFRNCDPSRAVSDGGCPDCGIWKGASTTRAASTSTTVTDLGTTSTDASPSTTTSETTSSTTTITGVDTSTLTTTSSGASVCVDDALPATWSGGGVHTCATYDQLGGSAYCSHAALKAACCFCGGGQQASTTVLTTSPETTTTTTPVQETSTATMIVTTTVSATDAKTTSTTPFSQTATTTPLTTTTISVSCADTPLPAAWSAGGVHTCSTYEQHGGLAYCAHKALAEACCFCKAGGLLSALSLQGGANYSSPQGVAISRASVFKPVLLMTFCLFYYASNSIHR